MSLALALPPVDLVLLAVIERDRTIPSLRTGLFLPSPLTSNLPLVTATCLPGSSSATEASVPVDLNVYTATRGGPAGGRAVCDMVERIVAAQPLVALVGSKRYVLDAVAGSTFAEVPWDDETVRHYLATVQVDVRRS
jgi:hypothetical protein